MSAMTSRSDSIETAPLLNRSGGSTEQSTMVDSSPIRLGLPRRIQLILPSRSCATVFQSVELGLPEMLAEGAATGWRQLQRNSVAVGCDGQRIPTVGKPAVTMSGIERFFFTTTVSGPGKKRPIRSDACSLTCSATSPTCSGLHT